MPGMLRSRRFKSTSAARRKPRRYIRRYVRVFRIDWMARNGNGCEHAEIACEILQHLVFCASRLLSGPPCAREVRRSPEADNAKRTLDYRLVQQVLELAPISARVLPAASGRARSPLLFH